MRDKMLVAAVLRSGAGVLRTFGWCTGNLAKDSDGEAVAWNKNHSDPPSTFCAVGAVYRAGWALLDKVDRPERVMVDYAKEMFSTHEVGDDGASDEQFTDVYDPVNHEFKPPEVLAAFSVEQIDALKEDARDMGWAAGQAQTVLNLVVRMRALISGLWVLGHFGTNAYGSLEWRALPDAQQAALSMMDGAPPDNVISFNDSYANTIAEAVGEPDGSRVMIRLFEEAAEKVESGEIAVPVDLDGDGNTYPDWSLNGMYYLERTARREISKTLPLTV